MDKEIKPLVREIKSSDINLITNAWNHSIRKIPPFSWMPPEVFKNHNNIMLKLLSNKNPGLVYCDSEMEDFIYGFIVARWIIENKKVMPVIDFIFTKRPFRGEGVAENLLKEMFGNHIKEEKYYTHRTRDAKKLEQKWNMKYNPYLLQ